MIFLYFDRGWRLSEDDRELGGPFDSYDELIAWAIEKEFVAT